MATDWQGRCSRLVALMLPARGFAPGEFEALDGPAWAALEVELRDAAKTDARLELARQALADRENKRAAAMAKLTPAEREALGV